MDAIFDPIAARKIFKRHLRETYFLEKGRLIADPEEAFSVGDARFTRRQIKHVVEQRKADGASEKAILRIFEQACEAILKPDFTASNTNPRHPKSIMRVKIIDSGGSGVVVVMDEAISRYRNVITVFIRDSRGIKKLKNKKLQESASGETPRP